MNYLTASARWVLDASKYAYKRLRGTEGRLLSGYKKARAENFEDRLKVLLDIGNVQPRRLDSAAKTALKEIALKLNNSLGASQLEDVSNTAHTRTVWEFSLTAARSSNNRLSVTKAVEAFAKRRFDMEELAPSTAYPTLSIDLISSFLLDSLFCGTLEGHMKRRLAEAPLSRVAHKFSFPIVCHPEHIPLLESRFSASTEVERDEQNVAESSDCFVDADGNSRVYEVKDTTGERVAFPFVLRGRNSRGSTVFTTLAPEFRSAHQCAEAKEVKDNTLIIYTSEKETNNTFRVENYGAQAFDVSPNDAKNEEHRDEIDLHQECSAAAVTDYLTDLVLNAIGFPGMLELREEQKYDYVYLVVDDLTPGSVLFSALLVEKLDQESLLNFSKGFTKGAQLICRTTGGRYITA